MIRHAQTILADPERGDGHDANGVPGDCYRTAIACLLDLPVLDVPHFVAMEDWWGETQAFLRARDAELYYATVEQWNDGSWAGYREAVEYVILDGPSPRGDFYHVVIGTTDLKFVHDPHPSQTGLKEIAGVFALRRLA